MTNLGTYVKAVQIISYLEHGDGSIGKQNQKTYKHKRIPRIFDRTDPPELTILSTNPTRSDPTRGQL